MNLGTAPLKVLSDFIKALLIFGTVFIVIVDFVGISVFGIDREKLEKRMLSIILFFILLVTVLQVIENLGTLSDNSKVLQQISQRLPTKAAEISFLTNNNEINKLGVDLIKGAGTNLRRDTLWGRLFRLW